MKYKFIFLIMYMISSCYLYPQSINNKNNLESSFYPLSIGNYWEYYDFVGLTGKIVDTISISVSGDTTIYDIKYFILKRYSFHYNYEGFYLERIDSLGDVYRYDDYNKKDVMLYRLSDTTQNVWFQDDYLVRFDSSYNENVFGFERRILQASYFSSTDTLMINLLQLV